MDTICDITSNATFPENSLEKERNIIFQEYQDYLDDSNSVSWENAIPEFYNSPEFKTSIIGTAETIKSITRQQLIDYYSEFYIPSRKVLSISGNFDKKVVDKIIKKYFNEKDNQPLTKNNLKTFPNQVIKTCETKFENENILFYYDVPVKTIKDSIVSDLVSRYIGSGFSSLLFQRIREELGLVYRIYSHFGNLAGNYGITIQTTCDRKSIDKIIEEVPKTIEESKNITEEKLKEIKNKFLYSKLREFDANSSIATRNLNQYIDFDNFYNMDDIKGILNEITLDDFISVSEIIVNSTPSIVISSSKVE